VKEQSTVATCAIATAGRIPSSLPSVAGGAYVRERAATWDSRYELESEDF
jgi:hypothetical protein